VDLYEHISDEYDEVTGAGGRQGPAEAMLAELRRRHPFERVLDVACGNGLHAMILARMGVDVTGADISRHMLDQARARAEAAGLRVRWVHAAMQEIAGRVEGPFDAILCLGNSLPHLLDVGLLERTLAGFAELLAPRGVAVLQLLNFARVLDRQERIVGVTRRGDREYIRFYDFLGDLVRFNVLTLDWSAGRCEHKIVSTPLHPYTPAKIAAACRSAGLTRIDFFAGAAFAPFDERQSETVMVVARRP
jgi:SAM-dependent methyltransferase